MCYLQSLKSFMGGNRRFCFLLSEYCAGFPRFYYQYIPEGKEYPVLCRRLETEGCTGLGSLFSCIRRGFRREEILLDWNEIAQKHGNLVFTFSFGEILKYEPPPPPPPQQDKQLITHSLRTIKTKKTEEKELEVQFILVYYGMGKELH